ncbi:hypothetical protein Sjap_002982 [Stephania japonica]|uniref:Bifunctional inhibitor/plant lipid transfer protein/seed storage helical domain-containing protein n=1 Tax=Stephania japonica TaxID=461633 RepID=A0AAP0KMV2_9MAGN
MGYSNQMWMLMMLLVVGALVVMRSPAMTNAQTCGGAKAALIPCGSYLMGSGAAPRPGDKCCRNVQSLNNQAKDKATRRALCQCFKDAAPAYGVKADRARDLPIYCKTTLEVPVSPNVDCTRLVEDEEEETSDR